LQTAGQLETRCLLMEDALLTAQLSRPIGSDWRHGNRRPNHHRSWSAMVPWVQSWAADEDERVKYWSGRNLRPPPAPRAGRFGMHSVASASPYPSSRAHSMAVQNAIGSVSKLLLELSAKETALSCGSFARIGSALSCTVEQSCNGRLANLLKSRYFVPGLRVCKSLVGGRAPEDVAQWYGAFALNCHAV